MQKYYFTRSESESKRTYYFTAGLGNPHKQGASTGPKKISETTVPSVVDVVPDSPGNPDDIVCHASGNKHLDGRAALEEPVAVAQKDPVEIPQAMTIVPETLVPTQQADIPELSVDGQETRTESLRAPRDGIPDSEFRESQDVI